MLRIGFCSRFCSVYEHTCVATLGRHPAEFLYGTTLRVPGEFFTQEDFTADPQIFVEDFRQYMRQIKPVPTAHHIKKRPFCFKDLYTYSHVFIRTDTVKKSLELPYTGRFKICERVSDRVFAIELNGRIQHIAVERLKSTHFISDDIAPNVLPSISQTRKEADDSTTSGKQVFKTPAKEKPRTI